MAMDVQTPRDALAICSIEEEVAGASVTLRGVATASLPATGRYRLQLRKSGPAGTSTISQGGEFSLDANRSARLGQVGFNLEPEGRYEAELTLESDGRRLQCRLSGPRSTPL